MSSYINSFFRKETNYIAYTEIALQHYFDAKHIASTVNKQNCASLLDAENEIFNHTMQTIVFSAMAVESYLNDYISSCIGDNEYYKKYDCFILLTKLDLIKRFIFHDNTKDSEKVFSYIRELQIRRNQLVHNKPVAGKGMSKEEIDEFDKLFPFDEQIKQIEEKTIESCIVNIKDFLQQELQAIKGIKSLCDYIDKNDDNAFAIITLFRPTIHEENRTTIIKREIYPLIGIKIQDYTQSK